MAALEQFLDDQVATEAFGRRLAACCGDGALLVFLQGPLGAGKTTLVRGFLHALGYTGRVKSPTYTLVEPYTTQYGMLYHLDLYRLSDPEELEWIGIRDLLDSESLCLIEWPEQGNGVLPEPDIRIHLQIRDDGRQLRVESVSTEGEHILRCLD
jgi:tRNA threonylcarbamoyladenosine biosynthesis protein TsaE